MRVNEIFYSLQGEGRNTGTPAVFLRLAGCNLRCPFCDTEFETYTQMSEEEIVAAVSRYPATLVVVTGGEPTLQLTASLVHRLHEAGKKVAIETNGTVGLQAELLDALDWITLSPKAAEVKIQRCDELKIVFTGQEIVVPLRPTHPDCLYLQPCDTGSPTKNAELLAQTIDYIQAHPQWRLSLQTHKLIDIK